MEQNKPPAEITEHPNVAFEPRDVNARALFMIGIGILVAGVVIHFGVTFLFDYLATRDARKGLQPSTLVRSKQVKQPPEPRLQVNPSRDLEEMRRAEIDRLNAYGWADQKAGVVKIPIERAMTLLVQRGLPSVQQAQSTTAETKQANNQGAETTVPRPPVNLNRNR